MLTFQNVEDLVVRRLFSLRAVAVATLVLCGTFEGCTRFGFSPKPFLGDGGDDARDGGLRDMTRDRNVSDRSNQEAGRDDVAPRDGVRDAPKDKQVVKEGSEPDLPPPWGQPWSKHLSSTGDAVGYGVAIDAQGNIYVTGRFQGNADFGGGALLTSAGDFDIFLASYTAKGALRWAKRFGDAEEDLGYDIALDPSGNIAFIGEFQGTTNLGGKSLVSAGKRDVVIASFTSAGAHRWSKHFGDSHGDSGRGIAVDRQGNLYITGHNAGTIDFGGGVLTSAGSEDGYLASLTSQGAHRWSKRFGATGWDMGRKMAFDNAGHLLLIGSFHGSTVLSGTPLTSAGGSDLFVASFTTGGTLRWAKRFGGTGDEYGRAIAIDAQDRLTITGRFMDSIDFGGGKLTSAGDRDIFMAGLKVDGTYRWARSFGAMGFDYGEAIVASPQGDVFLAGQFSGGVDFGQGML
ncbi:MAG: SBBP repeat-containing protein, partial [Deltaproteobacteria bacterium]|nr:SBBP repeat-containing protein [Deltaproteobacteria bacterium]